MFIFNRYKLVKGYLIGVLLISTDIVEVFNALRDIGISEEKAMKAAEASSESLATRKDVQAIDISLVKMDGRVVVIERLMWAVALGVLGLCVKAIVSL